MEDEEVIRSKWKKRAPRFRKARDVENHVTEKVIEARASERNRRGVKIRFKRRRPRSRTPSRTWQQ